MTLNKKIVGWLLGLVALLGGGSVMLGGSEVYQQTSSNLNVASTTATFIAGGDTRTITVRSDGVEQVSYLVAVASSSTPPTLCWETQFSNNGTDWYGKDNIYASSTAHISGDTQDCWVYSTTTGTVIISTGNTGVLNYIGRKVIVSNLDTIFTRTVFLVNSGVNAFLDVRTNLKNAVIIQK